MSATDRLRGILPKKRMRPAQAKATTQAPEPEKAEAATGLPDDRLGAIAAYISEYPTDESERRACNDTLHEPSARPPKQVASTA